MSEEWLKDYFAQLKKEKETVPGSYYRCPRCVELVAKRRYPKVIGKATCDHCSLTFNVKIDKPGGE